MKELEILALILSRLDLVNKRIDDLHEQMMVSSRIQTEHHVVLKEHIRRTEAAEKSIEILVSELRPVQAHVTNLQFIGRLILWGLSSGGLVFFLLRTLLV